MLSGGTALDALIADYNVTGDASLKAIADKLFKGMMLCANCGKTHGFIARAVSPKDGVSHYTDTSRDQYTHWVYAAIRLYNSSLCDNGQKAHIRRVLVALAERCETNVTKENDYNILRDDGKKGLVGKMWGDIGPHEYLRLPMFYLAAYHVSGDGHWKEMCFKYRDEALEKSELKENRALYPIREIGEYASVAALCPKRRVDEKLLGVLESLAEKIDYKNHYTYAPMLLVSGYKLCLENLN